MILAYSLHDKVPNPVYRKTDRFQIVKTLQNLVDKLLNDFPKEVWSNKDLKWLNPVSKTGVFELNIFIRLLAGLKDVIPDKNERRDHIVQNMIWSFCPNEGSELICKRYFLGKAYENIRAYREVKSNVCLLDFLSSNVVIKDGIIMAKKKSVNKNEEFVKFDCIVGNPPYQDPDGEGGKGSSAKALYPDFVLKCMECNPQYLCMVIPARWMSGSGKGTQDFLEKMIACNKLSRIVCENDSFKWFPDVDIKGGVMYFLLDNAKQDSIININGLCRDISGCENILTDTNDIAIIEKVISKSSLMFNDIMCMSKPYGIRSSFVGGLEIDDGNSYLCHCKGGTSIFVPKSFATNNLDTIDKWKVCITKASGSGRDGTSKPIIVPPNEIVSETYFVMCCFDNETLAQNARLYFETKFSQFMITLLKPTQNMSSKVFKYLPFFDFSRSYSDQELYEMFELTQEQIDHVENTTKDFPMFAGKKPRQSKKASKNKK